MKIIVDLEATCCDQGTVPRSEMEIIEIGAVAYNEEQDAVIDQMTVFIKPIVHPQLTPFCTKLTTIQQAIVDSGVRFRDAAKQLKTFMNQHGCADFCSWGDYDKHQLRQDCELHKIPWQFGSRHENIKKSFARNCGLKKPCGLGSALQQVGLSFNGTAHRGIDDASNMARLGQIIWPPHSSL